MESVLPSELYKGSGNQTQVARITAEAPSAHPHPIRLASPALTLLWYWMWNPTPHEALALCQLSGPGSHFTDEPRANDARGRIQPSAFYPSPES